MQDLVCLNEILCDPNLPGKIIFIDDERPHPPVHWHANVELNYFVEGGFTAYIGGEKIQVEKDSLLLTNSGVVHFLGEYPLGEQPGISLILDLNFMRRVCPDFEHAYFDLSLCPQRMDILKTYFRELFDIYNSCGPTRRASKQPFREYEYLRVRGLINLICYELICYHCCFLEEEEPSRNSPKWDRFQNTVLYINEHYMEDLSLEKVAKHCGVTREHFSRLFRKQVGLTFREYLTRIRLEHAYRLLVHTNDLVVNIALNTGFPDLRGFNRKFKEMYKLTPKECRALFWEGERSASKQKKSKGED